METTQLFRDLPRFYHQWAPLTWCLGFLEAPLSVVETTILPWMGATRARVEGNTAEFFARLPPLTGMPARVMWCTTQSNWIAYVDSGYRGSSPSAPLGYLSRAIGCRGVVATCVPHTLVGSGKVAKGAYGAVQLELLGPKPTTEGGLNCLRSISVARDAGRKWAFCESGQRLSFEETDNYDTPDVRQRFTPDMLVRYCSNFGIELYDRAFYGPDAYILDFLDVARSKEWSLDAAKQALLIASSEPAF